MKRVILTPGADACIGIFVVSDSNGEPVSADATPTVVLYDAAGVDNLAASGAGAYITEIETGVYRVNVDTSLLQVHGYAGDTFWPLVTLTVSGSSRKIPLDCVEFSPPSEAGLVAASGSNTATSFLVSGAGSWVSLLDTTDDAAKALIHFTSGSLAGQVRKVTAYNASTGFLTVDAAFTSAPSSGDAFFLITY